jgi:hypothetical protein
VPFVFKSEHGEQRLRSDIVVDEDREIIAGSTTVEMDAALVVCESLDPYGLDPLAPKHETFPEPDAGSIRVKLTASLSRQDALRSKRRQQEEDHGLEAGQTRGGELELVELRRLREDGEHDWNGDRDRGNETAPRSATDQGIACAEATHRRVIIAASSLLRARKIIPP